MREILFRGKRSANGEWVEGHVVILPKSKRTKILVWNVADLDFDAVGVMPETVGQFTGLTDKNGKRIFEGDTLGHPGNVVEFCNGSFCINGDSLLPIWTNTIIVGNIYEK